MQVLGHIKVHKNASKHAGNAFMACGTAWCTTSLLLHPPQRSQLRKHRWASQCKVKKRSFPPHLWPGLCLLTSCTWMRPERWELSCSHSKQEEQRSIHRIPGRLFLFINYRWNLANHTPTPSVLGRWGNQLWVESTSFLPKKRAVLFSSKYFWRRRASKTLRNSGTNEGKIIACSQ